MPNALPLGDRAGPPPSVSLHSPGHALQPADFLDDSYEATAEGREHILDFDGRLFAEHGAPHDAEAEHLAEPLVHYLRRQTRGRPEQSAGPAATVGEQPEQPDGPLASDDALDHRGDWNGRGGIGPGRGYRMS